LRRPFGALFLSATLPLRRKNKTPADVASLARFDSARSTLDPLPRKVQETPAFPAGELFLRAQRGSRAVAAGASFFSAQRSEADKKGTPKGQRNVLAP